MSAGGSGAPAEGAVDANVMLAIGIIGGLLGIYLSGINPVIGPVLSCLGAVCAILWGVIAIRSVASYGLGTGVPSIGYMSLGIGVIGALAGVGIIAAFKLTGLEIAGPILALIFAMLIGLLVAIVAKKNCWYENSCYGKMYCRNCRCCSIICFRILCCYCRWILN